MEDGSYASIIGTAFFDLSKNIVHYTDSTALWVISTESATFLIVVLLWPKVCVFLVLFNCFALHFEKMWKCVEKESKKGESNSSIYVISEALHLLKLWVSFWG